jgi:hypothetical protein
VAEPPAEPAAAIEKQRPAKPGIDGIKPRPRSS